MKLSNILLLLSFGIVNSYAPLGVSTRRSTMTMKRGRGSFKKEFGGSGGSASSSTGSIGMNWVTVPGMTVKDLPKEDGKVSLVETQAYSLVDKATNPNGAVSVMKYGQETYCFSSSCPQCKIPLTKAKALPPNEESGNAPRVSCDFCKASFELKNGQPVASTERTGFFGGIAKAVLSAQESTPLPMYRLGEKDGKILFSIE